MHHLPSLCADSICGEQNAEINPAGRDRRKPTSGDIRRPTAVGSHLGSEQKLIFVQYNLKAVPELKLLCSH